MNIESNKLDRRNFLKTVGASGLGVVLAAGKLKADANEPNKPKKEKEEKFPQVPKRVLGKTGVEVPVLTLGFSSAEQPIVLKKALQWGVNCWDTSLVSAGGNSELGIGQFITKNREVRKDLFIVTKESGSKTPADVEKCLKTSLERINTSHIDLYFGVYMMSDPAQLTDELKVWVKSAKERKLIRYFGFSTHSNMAKCLTAAAKCGWVDAIMTSYNFRLMQDAEMQIAVEACYKAGVGLIAMKTQGHKIETPEDKKLSEHFLQRGFTEGQAKIKAVLEDKRISCACVSMGNVAVLTTNVAAVLDKTTLTQADMQVFKEYALETCSGYCAGCENICRSALPAGACISDVMRYLMYYNSYGERDTARQLFAQIPEDARNKLLTIDYSLAQSRCPQHLPIGKLVAEAVSKLA